MSMSSYEKDVATLAYVIGRKKAKVLDLKIVKFFNDLIIPDMYKLDSYVLRTSERKGLIRAFKDLVPHPEADHCPDLTFEHIQQIEKVLSLYNINVRNYIMCNSMYASVRCMGKESVTETTRHDVTNNHRFGFFNTPSKPGILLVTSDVAESKYSLYFESVPINKVMGCPQEYYVSTNHSVPFAKLRLPENHGTKFNEYNFHIFRIGDFVFGRIDLGIKQGEFSIDQAKKIIEFYKSLNQDELEVAQHFFNYMNPRDMSGYIFGRPDHPEQKNILKQMETTQGIDQAAFNLTEFANNNYLVKRN